MPAKKIAPLVGLFLGILPNYLFCQTVTIERDVVASTGDFGYILNDINVTYTLGEMAVETKTNDDVFFITEGFQQADGNFLAPLTVSSENQEAQCPDIKDGQIVVNPEGCLGPYSIELAGPLDTFLVDDVVSAYTFTDLDSGDYRVTVRGFTLCSERDTIRIDFKNNTCDTKFYTGITPNGDGKNDFWIIDNIEINQPNEVSIFDRWGNDIWKASNYNNSSVAWNGTNQSGRELPSGTYFYTISINGGKSAGEKSGWIQIIR